MQGWQNGNAGRERLPADLVNRQPFPGPGLAIRIPGDITREKLDLLREVDAVYLDEIRKSGLCDEIWQAFAVLLPVRTVGVRGDGRTYDQACALRAVTSTDTMTACDAPFDHTFVGRECLGKQRGEMMQTAARSGPLAAIQRPSIPANPPQ